MLAKSQTRTLELPLHESSLGAPVLDATRVLKDHGVFLYDPGFTSTASCESQITFVDGKNGKLLYRGYPIEQLAAKSTYLEVCYLLMNGELPSKSELAAFEDMILRHTMVNEQMKRFFDGFRRDAHPMAILCGAIGGMSAFYHDSLDIEDPQHREISAHRLIAKLPTLVAMSYKYSIGQPYMFPDNRLSYTGNFLRMMFGTPCEPYEVNPVIERALDKIFMLHADHEQNASTSTVRLAGSSGANPFACIAAGVASLWGPAHGGANEAVLNMLEDIGEPENIPAYLEAVRNKEKRLMGFGHRVYKNFDPRATILRDETHAVLKELGKTDKRLDIAMELERIALEDPYFKERNLYPNVDFYSGIILSAIGIPTNMFTCLFALGRTVGWVSHWREMIRDEHKKIGRPRQWYTGKTERDYVGVGAR